MNVIHEDAMLILGRLAVLDDSKVDARAVRGVNQNEGSASGLANESLSLPTSKLAPLVGAGVPMDIPVAFCE
jgi:hypothetical protein